jgi:serine/threonine protein kinase
MATVFVSWRDVTYEKIANAGKGGVGKVSKVLATSGIRKGVVFAVKEFSPDSPSKEDWRQNFMREVHVLRDCDHPAIVKVFDEGVLEDGRPFFVMEYLTRTLWQAMQESELAESAKVGVILQLLSALAYLSRRDPYVVHRDIKPKNISLKSETCVLGDFGLIFQNVERSQAGKTDRSIPAMAQMYRTPELVAFHKDGSDPPPASDVFQLGLVAAELFTGKNPLRHGGATKDIELEALSDIIGDLGLSVKTRLEEMLLIDTAKRRPARSLLPGWIDLYLASIRARKHPAVLQQRESEAEPTEPKG